MMITQEQNSSPAGLDSRVVYERPRIEISVVLPCLNEVLTLERCITKARRAIDAMGASGEVIVADNGSTDGSQAAAEAPGPAWYPSRDEDTAPPSWGASPPRKANGWSWVTRTTATIFRTFRGLSKN